MAKRIKEIIQSQLFEMKPMVNYRDMSPSDYYELIKQKQNQENLTFNRGSLVIKNLIETNFKLQHGKQRE